MLFPTFTSVKVAVEANRKLAFALPFKLITPSAPPPGFKFISPPDVSIFISPLTPLMKFPSKSKATNPPVLLNRFNETSELPKSPLD